MQTNNLAEEQQNNFEENASQKHRPKTFRP